MPSNQTGISSILVGCSVILGIVGDIVRVQVREEKSGNGAAPLFGRPGEWKSVAGGFSLAQVIGIKPDVVALQVRIHPSKMMRTNVPMIDVFNCRGGKPEDFNLLFVRRALLAHLRFGAHCLPAMSTFTTQSRGSSSERRRWAPFNLITVFLLECLAICAILTAAAA